MKRFILAGLSFIIIIVLSTCSKDDSSSQPTKFQLNVNVLPSEFGSVSLTSGIYDEGEQVTIEATSSSERYQFVNWTGDASGSVNPITINMNSDKVITANFIEVAPVYTDGEGTIGPLGGTVKVDDVSSPLNGVYVIIPDGALETDEYIEITLAENIEFPYDENALIIDLKPDGLNFLKDVELGIPYESNTATPDIFYYEPVSEEEINISQYPSEENMEGFLSTQISHFSYYLVWDSDNEITLEFDYLNINGKIGVSLFVAGRDPQSLPKLNWIKTTFFHKLTSHLNVGFCIDENSFHDYPISAFSVELFEYHPILFDNPVGYSEILIGRGENLNTGNPDCDVEFLSSQTSYNSGPLINEDIDFTNNFTIGNWMSGRANIVYFDNFIPDPGKEYYVKVGWGLYGSIIGYNSNSALLTPVFRFNTKNDRESLNEMNNNLNDIDNNQIIDEFQNPNPSADEDGDGVINYLDQCPDFDDALIGTSCDDGDPCTINDTYDENCECNGTEVGDSDGDGVCNEEDQCPGFDDNLIGTSCDDGDETTINDVYTDNCECAGTQDDDSDGDGVIDSQDQCPGQDDALIGTECDDGDETTINDVYTDNCECAGTQDDDSDGDGVIDSQDQCPGQDDALIGTECDDGDETTIEDVYTDNCDCEGTPDGDSDGDGVIDSQDQCPGFDDNLIGTSCDDGDTATINDVYTENCECEGVQEGDSDGDGVPDSQDQCPGQDDALIDTACDDNDPTTINDVYTDNCLCIGTQEDDSDGDGIVDSQDQCPGFDDNLIGLSCDDGDSSTINDVYTNNCECSGTPIDQQTFIPDDRFEQKLIDSGYDDILDNYVLTSNINQLSTLDLSNQYVDDFTGIEDFVNLIELNSENSLTWNFNGPSKTLNLSNNLLLEVVSVRFNNLDGVIISENSNLRELDVSENVSLEDINVSSNLLLEKLNVSSTQINNLFLSNNPNLTELRAYSVQNEIDLTNLLNLELLVVGGNDITSIDVTNNNNLTYLTVVNTQITNIDLSNNSNLFEIDLSNNQLTSINLSNQPNLYFILLSNNNLTSFDFSIPSFDIYYLDLSNNQITDVYIPFYDNAPYNGISQFNLSNNNLDSFIIDSERWFDTGLLDLSNNNLSEINTELLNLSSTGLFDISNNDISTIDLTNNSYIDYFIATQNPNLTCVKVIEDIYWNIPSGWEVDNPSVYALNCD